MTNLINKWEQKTKTSQGIFAVIIGNYTSDKTQVKVLIVQVHSYSKLFLAGLLFGCLWNKCFPDAKLNEKQEFVQHT